MVSYIHDQINYYDQHKGRWRSLWDQTDIAKLRAMHKRLLHVYPDRPLTAEEAFELVSLVIDNCTKQAALSAEIMSEIEESFSDLISLSRLLKNHNHFSLNTFSHIYDRLQYVYVIKSHLNNFVQKGIELTPAYIDVICKYAKEYDTFLVDSVIQCLKVDANDDFIVSAIKNMLQRKVGSHLFFSTIRHSETVAQLKQSIENSSNKEISDLNAVDCTPILKVVTHC